MAQKKEQVTRILVRVKRALFVAPERWAQAQGWSRPFRRVAEHLVVGDGPHGRFAYIPGLPVYRPLPFNRFADFYRLKASGFEGDQLVLYVA